MSERNKDKIKLWAGSSVELSNREYGTSRGTIQYGLKKPIAPQTDPLIIADPNSKELINGFQPQYYFVSTQHESLKIPLSALQLIDERTIRANASSAGRRFYVTIQKLKD